MTEFKQKIFTPKDKPTASQKTDISSFLHKHLGKYRDSIEDIEACIAYALKDSSSYGGFIITALDQHEIIGTVIINKTGMKGYIPENILVYIAVHSDYRGKGIGKKLMKSALKFSEGDVALHVEPDNPAKFLYEKLGFTNKYLEMRYHRS